MPTIEANPAEDLSYLVKVSRFSQNCFNVNVDSISPLVLTLHQVNAYNAKNLEAFLETYANDIEIYDFPDKLLVKGKEEMKKVYGQLFRNYPKLHCEVKDRMIQGSTVILKEHISGIELGTLQSIVIYEITENKISKVYFINQ